MENWFAAAIEVFVHCYILVVSSKYLNLYVLYLSRDVASCLKFIKFTEWISRRCQIPLSWTFAPRIFDWKYFGNQASNNKHNFICLSKCQCKFSIAISANLIGSINPEIWKTSKHQNLSLQSFKFQLHEHRISCTRFEFVAYFSCD